MALDPQAQAVMDQMAALGFPPTHTLSPVEAREYSKARSRAPGPEVGSIKDRRISLSDRDIPLRIYTPSGGAPALVLVWFHGGGWVVGDLDTADGTARHLSVEANCVVVSVGYRLAPETKFPGPAEDCFEAIRWVELNYASLNGDSRRIAVGGDSAGGNLAAAVSLMARDRGGPPLGFQLLVYPVTSRDFGTESYKHNADDYQLTRASMEWYWKHYLKDQADATNPYAAPLAAKDLSGLPPALVITAEYDPLRDEGEAYARRLQEAGVRAHHTCYDGMIHGFFGMPVVMDKGRQAIAQASVALKGAFAA